MSQGNVTADPPVGIIGSAKYKGGNITSWAILVLGTFLLLNGAVFAGVLWLAGGLITMPRFARYVIQIPTVVGYALVVIGFVSLP